MARTTWWATSGTAALLLALGSLAATTHAGETGPCNDDPGYKDYKCFVLGDDEKRETDTFVNGNSIIYDRGYLAPPGNRRVDFAYVQAIFTPSKTGQGFFGINQSSTPTAIMVYSNREGCEGFKGGDLDHQTILVLVKALIITMLRRRQNKMTAKVNALRSNLIL